MTENSSFWAKKGRVGRVNFNLYHYAGNSPVKYTDPGGMQDCFDYDVFRSVSADDIKKFNLDKFATTNCAAYALPGADTDANGQDWDSGRDGGYQPGKDSGKNYYKTAVTISDYKDKMEKALMSDGYKLRDISTSPKENLEIGDSTKHTASKKL